MSAHTSYRIASGTYYGIPVTTSLSTGYSSSPNPPNLISGFGSIPTLWLAAAHSGGGNTLPLPGAPANYFNLITANTGIAPYSEKNARMTTAQRELTAAAENPGIFVLGSPISWGANTVAIHGPESCYDALLTLTSAPGTDDQTVCANQPITPITYEVDGSATGATTTGLPAGVAGIYSAGVYTISGTPTVSGVFNYTVTTTGTPAPCLEDTIYGTLEVLPLPGVSCSGISYAPVCEDAPAFTLSGATPAGGTYSGPGVSGGIFDPSVAGPGIHTITYSYTDPGTGCSNQCTFPITVNALPVVACPDDFELCIDADPIVLAGGAPAGGNYSGPGVSLGIFDPSAAGSGIHTITYSYTDGNNCSNSCMFTITVYNLPVVTCPASFDICLNASPVTLSGGTPAGGIYSGPGVSGGIFDPGAAGVGMHTITYTYTDGYNCTNSCTFTIIVFALPVVTCPASFAVCCDDDAITLSSLPGISPAGGTFSGAGVVGGIFTPSCAFTGAKTIIYTYTDPSTGCTSLCSFAINVKPIPDAIATPASQTICSGSAITPINLTGSITGTTYSWTRNNTLTVTGIPASGNGNISGTLTNLTNTPITVTFTIIPSANGCTGTPITATVLVNPTPNVFASPNFQIVCHNSPTTQINFTSNVTGTIFNWTNNQPSIGLAASGTGNIASFIAVNPGVTPIVATITVTPSFTNGGITCTGTPISVTITVRPLPILTSTLTPPGICSGNIFSYIPASSITGTTYNWSRAAVPGILEPANAGVGSVNEVLTNTTANPITVVYVYLLSAAGCTNPTPFNVSVVVNPTPFLISDLTPPDICSGTVFNYTPESNVGGTTFEWTRPSVAGILPFGTNGTGNPNETLTNTTALPISVTYIYTLTADGCENPTTFNVVVVVNPTPLLSSTLTPPAICSGTLFSYTPTSNTPGTTFAWSRAVVAGISNPAAIGTGNPLETLINTTNTTVNVTYVFTLTANGCSHNQNVVVAVKPNPTVNPINNQTWCNGSPVPVTVLSGPVGGTTFTWVNDNTAIGLAAGGTGNIPAFTATNTTDDPIMATITITPAANGCTGTAFSYTITVYPSPLLTSSLTPPSICSGTLFSYEPQSNVTGATFNWTRPAVGGISNPAASGTGNPNETLINTTVNPVNVTYIYTVTANGCTSPSSYNVIVTVNPTPSLTSTLTPQAICSNTVFSYNPTSGTTGTVFNWSRPVVAGISNPAASGTGNPMEVLINTTNLTVYVTYIYTLTANSCSNFQNVVVGVKPSPTVDPVDDQEYCNGDAAPSTPLSGPVTGTTFTWTNNNTAIGLGASGTGDVPAFTATNITPAPLIATITIIPAAANCTGTPETYTITVYPSATVNPIANKVFCNGDNAPATPLTGPITGTTFTWTNSDPSIGLAASGTGDIPAFIATNLTGTPVVAIITVTPFYGTCDGIPFVFTITVNPTPTVNPVGNQSYCEGETVPQTVLTGTVTGTIFTWVNDNTGIGLAASGTGNIPSFVATNSTPNPIVATITITPSANGCTGALTSYTITVNPTPELSSTLDPPGICSESQFDYIPTSLTANVTFDWYRAAVAGIAEPANSGSGSISEVLTNTTFNPIAVTYEFTLTANGCSNAQNVVVVVSPVPTLTSGDPDPPTVCSNTPFIYTPSGPVTGTIFSWTRAEVIGISNPAASGIGTINETLINTTSNPIGVSYQYTMATPGCTNPDTIIIGVSVIPEPVVTASASATMVCAGDPFDLFSSSNLGPTLPPILLQETFESAAIGSTTGPNGWTTTQNPSSNSARWTVRSDGYVTNGPTHSNDNSKFYVSNNDIYNANSNNRLISPSINTVGYSTLTLDFWHYYRDRSAFSGDYAYIDISTDNGVTWSNPYFIRYTSTQGGPANFSHAVIDLSAYTGVVNLKIRFRYVASDDYYWAIDNVTVSGTSPTPSCTWTSIPDGPLFPYTGNDYFGVTQTVTTSYIATYVDVNTNCPGSDTITVEMAPVPEASITANYCEVPGQVVLTANPSPPGHTYHWSTGATAQSDTVDIVGLYSVTVTNSYGCDNTASLSVSSEFVVNGDFSLGNYGFTTDYQYKPDPYIIGVPTSGLWPEGTYNVWHDAQYTHSNFWGHDHTTGSGQPPDNFMLINGWGNDFIVWEQGPVTLIPNTDYYFAAWAISLNNVGPEPQNHYAQLRFEIVTPNYGQQQVGTIADLSPGTNNNNNPWKPEDRFYGTWNSQDATSAYIRIRNLEPTLVGNDFGLDDISFGTMNPFPAVPHPEANGGDPLCEGGILLLTANITGGLEPITYSWAGPDGFTSNLPNPIIAPVDEDNAGEYYLSVSDGYGCEPLTASTNLIIISAATATISPSDTVCVGDPEPLVTFTGAEGVEPYTFTYTLNGGPEQDITTISGNSISITVPTNTPGVFVYALLSVTDLNGCDSPVNDTCIITVGELPICLISGDDLLCPNTTGNIYSGPADMLTYAWSITGNGIISGPTNEDSVTVISGPLCDSTFTLHLSVAGGESCEALCSQVVQVRDDILPEWVTVAGSLDDTLQCSDLAGLAAAQVLAPEAADNCSATLNPVKSAGAFVPGSCANAGTYTNTWTVLDACGNEAAPFFTQVITIIDDTAPVWTTLPGTLDVNLDCDDTTGLADAQALVPVATDNCDLSLVPAKTAEPFVPGACANSGIYTNTFIAVDDCGNSSSVYTQVISIFDNTDPIITCPNNISIDCDESFDPANTGTAIAIDNCYPDPEITYSDVTIPGPCLQSYTIQRTWTASDDCANTISCTQIISVQDITAPVLVGVPPNISVSCDAIPAPATVTATDNCDPTVTVNFTELNNVIEGCGTITRTWSSSDDCGNSVSLSQVITVYDNIPPVLSGVPADATVACDAIPAPPSVTATDNCDPTITVEFNETINTVVNGCGEIIRTWSATDNCGNTVIESQTITVEDSDSPTWITPPGALDVTLQCNDASGLLVAQSLEPVASDNCDPDLTPVKIAGSFVPGDCPQAGTYANTWTVADFCGNLSVVFTQVITIIDNTAPAWDQAPNLLNRNLTCNDNTGLDDALALAPTATDNCGTADIELVSDITVDGGCNGSYVRTRKWTATDNCNNITPVQYTQIITVTDDVAPVWDQAAGALDVEVACDDPAGLDAALALEPTATDECFSGVTIYLESDDIYTGACLGTYTRVRTWSAADDCGNITPAVYTQTISVVDNEEPVFYNIPAGVTISCEDPLPPVPDDILAFDDCSFDVTADIIFTEDPIVPDPYCPNGGTITRTWAVDDACGNIAFATQIITLEDNTSPGITCPISIVVDADENQAYATVPIPSPVYSDNCSDIADIVINWTMTGATTDAGTGIIPDPYLFNVGVTVITYTVTDECGNTNYCQFTVTVEANDEPVITCPADISVGTDPGLCTATIDPGSPTLVSGSEPITWTWAMTGATVDNGAGIIILPNPFTFNAGTTLITWVATNVAGADTCYQTIVVVDDEPPALDPPVPFILCVEDIYQADYYDPTMDIQPDRPEYYLFNAGETTFDLDESTFTDNCCDPSVSTNFIVHWRIDFEDGSSIPLAPGAFITGQPSLYGTDIEIPGDGTNFLDAHHEITYVLEDCNNNTANPIAIDITVKPRPNVIKMD